MAGQEDGEINDIISCNKTQKRIKRRYECEECDYSSKERRLLKGHVRRKHQDNKCEYPGCNLRVSTPSRLREHMQVHANEKEYECDLCDYRSNVKSSLNTHKKNKHLLSSDEALHARSRAHKCSQCDFVSTSRIAIIRHESTHLDPVNRPFKCDKCSYATGEKKLLNNHMISGHDCNSQKPILTCDKCDFTAVTKNTIDKHVVRCTGIRPYTCTKCDYKTAVLKNLYSHAETHVDAAQLHNPC
jgi:KRAB domain-containing zinc finger protein